MTLPFSHSRRDRSWPEWAAASVTVFLLWLGVRYQAPWPVLAIWTAAGGALAWLLWRGGTAGVEVTADGIASWDGRHSWQVPYRDLSHARIIQWSEGPASIILHLKDGRQLAISTRAVPPDEQLQKALRAGGVSIEPDPSQDPPG